MKRLSKLRHLAAAVSLFLLIAPTPAIAQAEWIGFGAYSCAEFANLYTEDPMVENTFFSWAQGFMSGLNHPFLNAKATDLLPSSFNIDTQQSHIRHYCDQRPLVNYAEAVMNLYYTMQKKQGLPVWPTPKGGAQ